MNNANNYNKFSRAEKLNQISQKEEIKGDKPKLIIVDEVVGEKEEEAQPDPKSDVGKEEGLVTMAALNIREKPTKDSVVKYVLKKDDVVLIKGQKDEWFNIKHVKTGIEGYVMAEFVFVARIDQ